MSAASDQAPSSDAAASTWTLAHAQERLDVAHATGMGGVRGPWNSGFELAMTAQVLGVHAWRHQERRRAEGASVLRLTPQGEALSALAWEAAMLAIQGFIDDPRDSASSISARSLPHLLSPEARAGILMGSRHWTDWSAPNLPDTFKGLPQSLAQSALPIAALVWVLPHSQTGAGPRGESPLKQLQELQQLSAHEAGAWALRRSWLYQGRHRPKDDPLEHARLVARLAARVNTGHNPARLRELAGTPMNFAAPSLRLSSVQLASLRAIGSSTRREVVGPLICGRWIDHSTDGAPQPSHAESVKRAGMIIQGLDRLPVELPPGVSDLVALHSSLPGRVPEAQRLDLRSMGWAVRRLPTPELRDLCGELDRTLVMEVLREWGALKARRHAGKMTP